MKKLLTKKRLTAVFGLVLVALIALWVWDAFDIGARIRLASAVDDILAGRLIPQARKSLEDIEDRGRVVAALKEALEKDTDSVQGKIQLLDTLTAWQEPRAARRALESKSKSSRRAAAWRFHGDAVVQGQIRGIVTDWIRDSNADQRSLAALIVSKLKIKECVPALQEAIATAPETGDEVQFGTAALDALAAFKPEGFGDTVFAIAKDKKQHAFMRGKAFDLLGRIEGPPVEEVQALLLSALRDRTADNILRNKAGTAMRSKKFANEEAWKGLEEVLLREDDDHVIQRSCLYALGDTAPLERIRKLLLDRRVYLHPYFGIRVDVATGLAAMQVQERLALEILCDYMVDNDPKDFSLLVNQEGWMSFWALTGMAYGVAEQELFRFKPKAIRDEEAVREFLWKWDRGRPGTTHTMIEAVRRMITANLDEARKPVKPGEKRVKKVRRMKDLKRISETCRSKIDELLAQIEKEKQAAEQAERDRQAKEREAENDKAKENHEDQGPPLPPKKSDDSKSGDD